MGRPRDGLGQGKRGPEASSPAARSRKPPRPFWHSLPSAGASPCPETMGLWLHGAPLVLASGSTVRRAMLEAAGIPVEPIPAQLDERALEAQSRNVAPNTGAALLPP